MSVCMVTGICVNGGRNHAEAVQEKRGEIIIKIKKNTNIYIYIIFIIIFWPERFSFTARYTL